MQIVTIPCDGADLRACRAEEFVQFRHGGELAAELPYRRGQILTHHLRAARNKSASIDIVRFLGIYLA